MPSADSRQRKNSALAAELSRPERGRAARAPYQPLGGGVVWVPPSPLRTVPVVVEVSPPHWVAARASMPQPNSKQMRTNLFMATSRRA